MVSSNYLVYHLEFSFQFSRFALHVMLYVAFRAFVCVWSLEIARHHVYSCPQVAVEVLNSAVSTCSAWTRLGPASSSFCFELCDLCLTPYALRYIHALRFPSACVRRFALHAIWLALSSLCLVLDTPCPSLLRFALAAFLHRVIPVLHTCLHFLYSALGMLLHACLFGPAWLVSCPAPCVFIYALRFAVRPWCLAV